MNSDTRKTWKARLRLLELALLIALLLIMTELLLVYKHAYDNPDLYVLERGRPAAAAAPVPPRENSRPAMEPPNVRPEMPPRRGPGNVARPGAGGGVPGRRGGAENAAPGAPSGGGVLTLLHVRNQVVNFFSGPSSSVPTNSGVNATSELVMTNTPPDGTNVAAAAAAPSGGRIGATANLIYRPGRRGGPGTFRFAVP